MANVVRSPLALLLDSPIGGVGLVLVLVVVAGGMVAQPYFTVGAVLGTLMFVAAASERRMKFALLGLAVYTVFEPFLLNWAPKELYFHARFAPYGFMAACFAAIMLKRLMDGRSLWVRTPIDAPLALFAAVSVLSYVMPHKAALPLAAVAVAYQPFLRFIILAFYLIMYIDFDKKDALYFTKVMLGVVFVEGVIGIVQSVIGLSAGQFLAPKGGELGDTAVGGMTQFVYAGHYQIFGTLGRYQVLGGFMGMFMLLSYPLYKRYAGRRKWFLLPYSVALPSWVLAASRGPWLGTLVGFWAILAAQRKRSALIAPVVFVAGTSLLYALYQSSAVFLGWDQASAFKRILEVFSPDYWKVVFDTSGRLYYALLFYFDVLLKLGPIRFLFGFGPGSLGYTAIDVFGVYSLSVLDIPHDWQYYITDVNWAYIFGQTGILGLGAFAWVCLRLLGTARRVFTRTDSPILRDLALGYVGMWAFFMTTAFFTPAFELRALSLYFWIYSGIMVKLARDEAIAKADGFHEKTVSDRELGEETDVQVHS